MSGKLKRRTRRALLLAVIALGSTYALAQSPAQPVLGTKVVQRVVADGLSFKDLNKDGILNPYEDWRLTAQERAEDLLSRMTTEEKVSQMAHLTLYNPPESWFTMYNFGFALAYRQLEEGPREAAEWTNRLQEWSESARLGIPVIISMDSVMGASWVRGATLFPDQIGLAAARDVGLVRRLASMQREELLAMGVRMSLSPVADLSTEPRWARSHETYGDDADLASQMVVAAIEGLQGGSELDPMSVLACVKHFPGSGPQEEGDDGSPLVFSDETFPLHLQPFVAAIEAGAAAIMPYGYSTVPYLGGDAVENPAHESSTVMTELLREELGYQGIIQTDWGMHHLTAALAGADVLGGASVRDVTRVVEGADLASIDESVRRILIAKFQLGLFEDPYVNSDAALAIVGSDEHRALAREAASRSLTLLTAGTAFPLSAAEISSILVAGALAADLDALNSGWKCPDQPGMTILDAICEEAGPHVEVVYAAASEALDVGLDADRLGGVDAAVVVLGETGYTHASVWGTDQLDFPEEQMALLRSIDQAGIPIIAVVVLGRPYVLAPVLDYADSILVVYRPGVTEGAAAVAEAVFGKASITGVLPWQLPRSMDQVFEQREDAPRDIGDPLFDVGFGLIYSPGE